MRSLLVAAYLWNDEGVDPYICSLLTSRLPRLTSAFTAHSTSYISFHCHRDRDHFFLSCYLLLVGCFWLPLPCWLLYYPFLPVVLVLAPYLFLHGIDILGYPPVYYGSFPQTY